MKRNLILVVIVIIVAVIFAFINYSDSGKETEDNNIRNEIATMDATYTVEDVNNLKNTNNFLPGTIKHIFFGTTNSQGEADGFHYANIKGSNSEIIPDTKSTPNKFGVFRAKVKINGMVKSDDGGYSTFFPNSLSPQMVIDSINEAYNNAKKIHGNVYIGKASNGMEIEMYLTSSNKIISAFPKY